MSVPLGHPWPMLVDLGIVLDEMAALHVVHQPVDKKHDQWKTDALHIIGPWSIQLLGGDPGYEVTGLQGTRGDMHC